MSIDSVFVHKMWDDNELSKMVDGGVPFPMLSDAGGKVGRFSEYLMKKPGLKTGADLSSTRKALSRAMKC